MLNKWVTMKEQFNSGQAAERRPFLATDCSSLADCEKWRMQIVREVTKKVAAIQNAGLGEHKIRDLNILTSLQETRYLFRYYLKVSL